MYYKTPNVRHYVDFIVRYRMIMLLLYLALVLISVLFYRPTILSSDAMFWLKDSKELKRSESQQFATQYMSRLTISVPRFDEEMKTELANLQTRLLRVDGVTGVRSLFSRDLGTAVDANSTSGMVGVINTGSMDALHLRKLVKELHNDYCNVVDDDFMTFRFFILSNTPFMPGEIKIPGTYRITSTAAKVEWSQNIWYLGMFIALLIVLFRSLFRNFVSAFSALGVLIISTVLTFLLIYLLTGIKAVHMAMPFITISITLVDFLYFYYRWHVSHYKHDRKNALIRMLERSVAPSFWTTIITMLGLGSLLFIDSDIIRLLCLGVILSSLTGYIVNLTFLPALLSFFELKNTHVPYAKFGFWLASNELHYNRKYLFGFLGLTFTLILSGVYLIYGERNSFFELNVKNEQIEVKIPYEQLNLALIDSIDRFTSDLSAHFDEGLGEVVSLSTIIKSLNNANTQTDKLDTEALLQALFYLDLYGLADKYYDKNAVTLQINLFDINKIELIDWLTHYEGLNIYFIDHETLLGSAKFNQTVLLATSMFSALLIIGMIMGWIFRVWGMIFVGFIANATPIAWFGLLVKLLDIPLSFEMLIAMTISVALASDATVHFAYKFFRGRYYGRSFKHSLQKMFFYSGIPVTIGSAVLMSVFAALQFSQVHSLQLIGTYSAIMIILSLLTDLFLLPVLLLFIDWFDAKEHESTRHQNGAPVF